MSDALEPYCDEDITGKLLLDLAWERQQKKVL